MKEKLPPWAAGLIVPVVVTVCALINALVPDKYLGKAAPLINKGALAVGRGKNDPSVNG